MIVYKTEFPDFDDEIEFPDGFTDVSWCGDMCPSIACIEMQLYLWIDYKDPKKRSYETSTLPRFSVYETDEEGAVVKLIDSRR
jgi:hypothetical protein